MAGDESASDREAALAEFQTTMQRFLEAQENIMLAYLGGDQTPRGARQVLQPALPLRAKPTMRTSDATGRMRRAVSLGRPSASDTV